MALFVWQYDVKPGKVEEFEAHHGPDGRWNRFLSRARGYHGITLLRSQDGSSMLSFDDWRSEALFESYIQDPRNQEEFQLLVAGNRELTSNRREVGWFELGRGYQFGDNHGRLHELFLLPRLESIEALVAPKGPVFQLLGVGSPRFKGTRLYRSPGHLLLDQIWGFEDTTYSLPKVAEFAGEHIATFCEVERLGVFSEVK
jgi:heme-degrading monooxygenase HmoA